MRAIFFGIVFACVGVVHAYDVALILDSNLDEKLVVDPRSEEYRIKALFGDFVQLAAEASVPIIATDNMLVNMISFMADPHLVELYNQADPIIERFRTKQDAALDIPALKAIIKKIYPGEESLPEWRLNSFLNMLLRGYFIDNNLARVWDIYIHPHTSLILMLPKNYRSKHANGDCGFRLSDLSFVSDCRPQEILKRIISLRQGLPIDLVTGLIAMFKPNIDKTNGWHIYLTGHGGRSKKEFTLYQDVASAKERLDAAQEDAVHLPYTGKFYVQAAEKEHQEVHEKWEQLLARKTEQVRAAIAERIETMSTFTRSLKRTLLESERQKYQGYIDTAKKELALMLQENIPDTAQVAGISLSQFREFVRFCAQRIHVNYFHYATCFGGGANQAYINHILTKVQASFIVSAEGVNEYSIFAYRPDVTLAHNKHGKEFTLDPQNFRRFFGLLNDFFHRPEHFIAQSKSRASFRRDPLAGIVRALVGDDRGVENMPTVRVPRLGMFMPLQVDKTIEIVTATRVKAYSIEKKTLDLSVGNKQSVIFYTNNITMPLKLAGQDVVFVSPATSSRTPLYVYVDSVTLTKPFVSFIRQLIKRNNIDRDIVITVRTINDQWPLLLDGVAVNWADKKIENFVLHITKKESTQREQPCNVSVGFEYNGDAYEATKQLSSFDEDDLTQLTSTMKFTKPKKLSFEGHGGGQHTVVMYSREFSQPIIQGHFGSTASLTAAIRDKADTGFDAAHAPKINELLDPTSAAAQQRKKFMDKQLQKKSLIEQALYKTREMLDDLRNKIVTTFHKVKKLKAKL